jgi:excisionase family DNA binding protein
VTRLTVTPSEAAEMLGVSRSYFYEHVLPELRTIYRGRKRLIRVAEIERWADRSASAPGRRT